jgi:hypothetical protein
MRETARNRADPRLARVRFASAKDACHPTFHPRWVMEFSDQNCEKKFQSVCPALGANWWPALYSHSITG